MRTGSPARCCPSSPADDPKSPALHLDVYNTTRWKRTDLAVVPGNRRVGSITDENGQAVSGQRFVHGRICFHRA